MACSTCQQDAAERNGRPDSAACPLCQTPSATTAGRRSRTTRRDSLHEHVSRFFRDDAWELEADLRDCGRLVRQSRILAGSPNPVGPLATRSVSTQSAAAVDARRLENEETKPTSPRVGSAIRGTRAKRRAPTPLTYSALASGAVVLIAGLTFLTLAVAARRPDWWNPGLPMSLLGQAALTLGIVLQIEDLRPRVRRTSA